MKKQHNTQKRAMASRSVSKGMVAFRTVVTTVVFCGVYFLLFSSIGISLAYGLAVLPGCVFAVCFKIFSKKKYGKLSLLVAAGILSVVLFASNIPTIFGSATKWVNLIIATANQNMHWGFGSVGTMPSTVFSDFAFAAILSVWSALLIAVLSENVAAVMFGNIVYVLLLLFVGLLPNPMVLAVLSLATVGECGSVHEVNMQKAAAVVVMALILVSVVGSSFLYGGSNAVNTFKSNVAKATEKISYGEDSLPQGQLKKALTMISEDTRLYVTLPEQTPSLYLRGFVGSTLEGTEWSPTDKNAYVTADSQGLIKYLEQRNFPFGQHTKYLEISGHEGLFTVDVENVGANSKYVYAPYSLSQPCGMENYDMNLYRGVLGAKKYSYQIATYDSTSERTMQNSWLLSDTNRTDEMHDYIILEGAYRKFVYDTYCELPDGQREQIRQLLGGNDGISLFSVSQLIRTWFTSNLDYSAIPDALHDDFFNEFFGGEIHNVNSAYCAAAATLAFRAYGYPARYVEGYLVRAGALEERTTVEVTGKNSHAWTEVYFEGIGWLPVEVTLTFFTDADLDPNSPPSDDPFNGESKPNVEPKPSDPEPGEERPDDPIDVPPQGTPEHTLYVALKVVTPILAILTVVLMFALVIVLRRNAIVSQKHKQLNVNGEAYGRAVIKILNYECREWGGFTQRKTSSIGISDEDTQRFIELVERAVYGGYDLSVNEKNYVESYIDRVSVALSSRHGFFYRFYCKFFRCLGL